MPTFNSRVGCDGSCGGHVPSHPRCKVGAWDNVLGQVVMTVTTSHGEGFLQEHIDETAPLKLPSNDYGLMCAIQILDPFQVWELEPQLHTARTRDFGRNCQVLPIVAA